MTSARNCIPTGPLILVLISPNCYLLGLHPAPTSVMSFTFLDALGISLTPLGLIVLRSLIGTARADGETYLST